MALNKDLDSNTLGDAFDFIHAKRKAIHGLRGILAGIVADQRLNEKELLFMDSWLQSQRHLSGQQDVLAILRQVGDVLADGIIKPAELEQLQSQLRAFLHDHDEEDLIIAQVDVLMGFLSGIASDGMLNDQEVEALSAWLDEHSAVRQKWPASVIIERLDIVLADGIISEEEREDLLRTVLKVTGTGDQTVDLRVEASTEVWEDAIDSLDPAGQTFCLSGDFVSGDRAQIETMLKLQGASVSPNVNRDVSFLVIGTLASRDWLYTSHGRKIEKALMLKREGTPIQILTERTLVKYLRPPADLTLESV